MYNMLARNYKESPVEETIHKLKHILETYKILPKELYVFHPYPELYSSRISLPEELGGFATNGKGRTEDFCRASAYAEFVERIQNGVHLCLSRTLQSQFFQEFGFYYDPREKFLSYEEFCKLPKRMIVDLVRYEGLAIEGFVQSYFDRLKAHNLPGVVAVPFYCSRSKQEEYLPINLIKTSCGTNGMAAGNSYNEAFYQALCELMERWAAARIFFDRLTPPTIPDDYLKQYPAEFNIIENIQKSGKYSVTIKDFSAGLRLPSVGVIVRNTQKNSYRLNVGCDTSFQVALSRCLTEVYQGMGDEEAFDDISLEIPQEDASCLDQEDEASMQARFSAYSKFTANGTGVFPPSLFRETASYEFDPSIFNGHGSYQEEVETIIAFFHALGYTVYIRDVSYLGFPSVYVYVPEVSSLGKKNVPAHVAKPTYDLIEADKIEPLVYRFKQGHPEDLSQLEASLQTLPIFSVVANLFGIELEEDCPGSFVNVALLLALVWFKLGKLDESAKAFFVYQSNCPDKIGYYQAIEKYVRILASGSSAADSREKLEMELGNTEDVRQACDDIDNIDAFIKRLPLPECPNCSTCLLNADCKTRKLMEVSRRLYPAMTEHNKSRA